MLKFFYCFMVLPLIFAFSCSEDKAKTENPTLIEFFEEATGENCQHGGKGINTGIDLNGNGSLDEDEINDTAYICDNEDGSDGKDGEDGIDGNETIDGVDGNDGTDGEDGTDGQDGSDGICADNTVPVISEVMVSPEDIRVQDNFTITVSTDDPDTTQSLNWQMIFSGAQMIDSTDGTFNFTAQTPGTWNWKVVVSDGCEISVQSFEVTILNKNYSGLKNPFESQITIENNSGENHEYALYLIDDNADITPLTWKLFKLNDDSDLNFELKNEFEIAVIEEYTGSETFWYIPGKTGDSSKLYVFTKLSENETPEWSVSDEGLDDGSFSAKNSSSSYKPFNFYLMQNENRIFTKENVLLDETVRFTPVPKLYLHKVITGETFAIGEPLPASVEPSSDIEINLLDNLASQITVKCESDNLCTPHYGKPEYPSFSGIPIEIRNLTEKILIPMISSSSFDVNVSFDTLSKKAWKKFNLTPADTAQTTFSTETELAVYEDDFPQKGDLRRTFVPDRTVETGEKWGFYLTSPEAFSTWSKSTSSLPDTIQAYNNVLYRRITFSFLKSGSPISKYDLSPNMMVDLTLSVCVNLYVAFC